VKVGPGEFRESVTVDRDSLTIVGSGRTKIVSFNQTCISVNANFVSLRELVLESKGPYKNDAHGIDISGSQSATITSVHIVESSHSGIYSGGATSNHIIANVRIESVSRLGIALPGASSSVITNCAVRGTKTGNGVYITDDDNVLTNITIEDVATSPNESGDGVELAGSNGNIVAGLVIKNVTGEAIDDYGSNNIIANNILINANGIDTGTGTLLDSNIIK
jgi:hypothetical protein